MLRLDRLDQPRALSFFPFLDKRTEISSERSQRIFILEPSQSVVLVLSALIERVIPMFVDLCFFRSEFRSLFYIAPSGYVITFEFLKNKFPICDMWETIAHWVTFFTDNNKVFYFTLALLCIQGLFLIYLLLALFIHRKDRKELERIAISMGVDVLFKYSWRGVELKISHPTDRSTPTQGNQPPSPPLGD